MISRRKFVAFLSTVPLVGKALAPNTQYDSLLLPGRPAPEFAEEAWAQFASELTHALADLDEDEFLILTTKKGWYYVQFAAQGSFGMRAEATSNGFGRRRETVRGSLREASELGVECAYLCAE